MAWTTREDCPRQGSLDGPKCNAEAYKRIQIFTGSTALAAISLRQNPSHGPVSRGTFSLRSPIRPNPIGRSLCLLRREGSVLVVRGLDCLDGTPLVDLKPDRCAHTPAA